MGCGQGKLDVVINDVIEPGTSNRSQDRHEAVRGLSASTQTIPDTWASPQSGLQDLRHMAKQPCGTRGACPHAVAVVGEASSLSSQGDELCTPRAVARPQPTSSPFSTPPAPCLLVGRAASTAAAAGDATTSGYRPCKLDMVISPNTGTRDRHKHAIEGVSASSFAHRDDQASDTSPKDDEFCTPRVKARPRSPSGLFSTPPASDHWWTPPHGGFSYALDLQHALEDENDGRFRREFSDVKKVGEGSFSVVFSARHNVDQCLYAVKRTKQITRSKFQVQEVLALASIASTTGNCPNIVRYNSSWFEGGQLFIQMELCEGSLRDHMQKRPQDHPADPRYSASEITDVVNCVASGLNSMHTAGSNGFVHLDIKPDNIMRGCGGGKWKIGDFGFAVAAFSDCDVACEGDRRYVAREVLRGDHSQLQKGDVFSLGAMAYELAIYPQPLPDGGEGWQALRDGFLDASLMPNLPPALLDLIASLVQPSPANRPNCGDILQYPSMQPDSEVRALQRDSERIGKEAEENLSQADRYHDELFRYQRLAVARVDKGRSMSGSNSAGAGEGHPGGCMQAPADVLPRSRLGWARANTM
mmetsp:Transcript_28112/g.71000  ORF Transcript_28112/g.71000 Transcript_28112/m.71000 type:complete len:586 (-) Transcript_28112:161-1918(-)